MSSAQENKDKRREEELGIGGAVAGGAAAYEGHEAKKNPEDAKHKKEEEALGGGAVASEGAALYERHEKKKLEKEGEAL